MPLLDVIDLHVSFSTRQKELLTLRGVSLCIHPKETLVIVGESGSGKTVLTKAITGMLEENGTITKGQILFNSHDLATYKTDSQWKGIRGKQISTVFQDPMTALNPVLTVGFQLTEVIMYHKKYTYTVAKQLAINWMERVGISDAKIAYHKHPHEFSGGMRQRLIIAIALACEPSLLICDEPTTALDVTMQSTILDLLRQLQDELGFGMIFITHDFGVVAKIAMKVLVMYAGEIIESGTVEDVFYKAAHPYTWALLMSLPQLNQHHLPYYLSGIPPVITKPIQGDAFAPRNQYALTIDYEKAPPIIRLSETHEVKSWLYDKRSPQFSRPDKIDKLHHKLKYKTKMKPILKPSKVPILTLNQINITLDKQRIISDVSFNIYEGETFALVGESGSGKSTIAKAILQLVKLESGEIRYKDKVISNHLLKQDQMMLAKEIQMIFQDPHTSLNDRATVEYILSEGMHLLQATFSKQEKVKRLESAIASVGLRAEHLSRYPHEFSGGQRQRIGIARALMVEPKLVIADEPISSLDVSLRGQVLRLLDDLQQKHQLTYLFIAHDLAVVQTFAHTVGVIYHGELVELAPTHLIFGNPIHPYTKSLLSAIPIPDPILEKEKTTIHYQPKTTNKKRQMIEVEPEHFVFATASEIIDYLNV